MALLKLRFLDVIRDLIFTICLVVIPLAVLILSMVLMNQANSFHKENDDIVLALDTGILNRNGIENVFFKSFAFLLL